MLDILGQDFSHILSKSRELLVSHVIPRSDSGARVSCSAFRPHWQQQHRGSPGRPGQRHGPHEPPPPAPSRRRRHVLRTQTRQPRQDPQDTEPQGHGPEAEGCIRSSSGQTRGRKQRFRVPGFGMKGENAVGFIDCGCGFPKLRRVVLLCRQLAEREAGHHGITRGAWSIYG